MTVAVICYKSKTLANGEHPLMLRVTKGAKRKYVAMGISCDPRYWDFERNTPKRSHPNRIRLERLITRKKKEYLDREVALMDQGRSFTPDTIVEQVEHPINRITVFDYFTETVDYLKAAGRIGYAEIFQSTYNSFKKFRGKKDLTFNELDVSVLRKYERYLRERKVKGTTLSVYFRTLRTLYNNAINEDKAHPEDYPFKRFSLSHFNTSTQPRAISREEITKIVNLDIPEDSTLFEARQYFLFSYYGFGINFTDMAKLRWFDIHGDRIVYERAKTGRVYNFKLRTEAGEIIEYYRPQTGGDSNNYIFPILDRGTHKSESQIKYRVKKVRYRVNRDLKKIGEQAGISIPLTTYVARHTAATVLKMAGTPTAVISQALGHNEERTTQIYLDKFGNDILDEAGEKL